MTDGAATAQYPKLNQILAMEKGVRARTGERFAELYKQAQKPALFNGFNKTYSPKTEGGETFPPEKQRVQIKAEELIRESIKAHIELADMTATRDWANTEAKADIVLDDEVLVKDAPAPFILWLEKQVDNVLTVLRTLPTLDEAETWAYDENAVLWKSDEISTHKTSKTQKGIVLYDATEKHPAQTQLIVQDEVVGYWKTIKVSGALPTPRKAALIARAEKLLKAVQSAREVANMADAPRRDVGSDLFNYLLAE